jgi:hypothetical protein
MHYHAYTLNQGLILRVHCNRKIEIETSQKNKSILKSFNFERSGHHGGGGHQTRHHKHMALPINKMLSIYPLCPHSEHQKNPF